jgi:hypothetical protein
MMVPAGGVLMDQGLTTVLGREVSGRGLRSSPPKAPAAARAPSKNGVPKRKRTRLRCNRGGCIYVASDKADLEYSLLFPLSF